MLDRPAAEAHVASLFALLEAQGQGDYIGERISQLSHVLQAAHAAREAQSAPTTVLAALLHDVGQFLPHEELDEAVELLKDEHGAVVGRRGHEAVGEAWLKQNGWPREVYELVGAHVVAKRWLTATDTAYYNDLSDASKASLKHQGGPFTTAECEAFERDPLFREKVALRRWDDAAKQVGIDHQIPDLDTYRDMAVDVLCS